MLLELGEFNEAQTVVDEALETSRPVGDRKVEASARLTRMLVSMHSGESGSWSDGVLELTTELIPLLEQQEAHSELSRAWRLVALAEQMAGQLAKASETIAKFIHHARLARDERMVARSALGLTFNAVYGPTPAIQAIAECEALIAGDFADRQVQNPIICKVAQLYAMVGNFEKARTNVKSARSVLRDLGQAVRAASSSIDVAIVELLAGDAAGAEREIRPDCETLQSIGETYFLSSMAATLARALAEQGRDDEALTWIETAERASAEDDIDAQAESRCVRALILARKGSLHEAEALVRKAVELAGQLETPALRGASLCRPGDRAASCEAPRRGAAGTRRSDRRLHDEGRHDVGGARGEVPRHDSIKRKKPGPLSDRLSKVSLADLRVVSRPDDELDMATVKHVVRAGGHVEPLRDTVWEVANWWMCNPLVVPIGHERSLPGPRPRGRLRLVAAGQIESGGRQPRPRAVSHRPHGRMAAVPWKSAHVRNRPGERRATASARPQLTHPTLSGHNRYGEAVICAHYSTTLLGAKQDRLGDRDPERFRGFEVYHQFQLGRLLD